MLAKGKTLTTLLFTVCYLFSVVFRVFPGAQYIVDTYFPDAMLNFYGREYLQPLKV